MMDTTFGAALRRANQALAKSGDAPSTSFTENLRRRCELIKERYPGTTAAAEAERTLRHLSKTQTAQTIEKCAEDIRLGKVDVMEAEQLRRRASRALARALGKGMGLRD